MLVRAPMCCTSSQCAPPSSMEICRHPCLGAGPGRQQSPFAFLGEVSIRVGSRGGLDARFVGAPLGRPLGQVEIRLDRLAEVGGELLAGLPLGRAALAADNPVRVDTFPLPGAALRNREKNRENRRGDRSGFLLHPIRRSVTGV